MSAREPREPGSEKPLDREREEPQKPGIEVEREQAGVDGERTASAPPETLLPPD